MKIYHGSLEIVKTPKILPRKNGHMAEITQDNFRSLLPVKEASVIMKIKQDKNLTLKEAYMTFFASEIYRQLETEETKRWWQSAEQIFEDGR